MSPKSCDVSGTDSRICHTFVGRLPWLLSVFDCPPEAKCRPNLKDRLTGRLAWGSDFLDWTTQENKDTFSFLANIFRISGDDAYFSDTVLQIYCSTLTLQKSSWLDPGTCAVCHKRDLAQFEKHKDSLKNKFMREAR